MSGCCSPRLIEMAAALGRSAAIYRHWSQFYDHGKRDVAGEHRAIFDATVARDADLACRLHTAHIQRTADIVTSALAGGDTHDENPATA
jgi:GntR family carbon starvation induced transcriptional regulator